MVIITDIFGNNNINNNTPFIVVFGNDLDKYLFLKDSVNLNNNTLTNEVSQIYTINKNIIVKLFNKNNLNLNNFVLSSDLLIINNSSINKILFINKNIGRMPEDFISIELYNKGTIWEPIGVLGYKSIGLIYNNDNKKPKINSIYMLPVDILLKINYGPYDGINTFNEFKNLSNNIHGFWTIDRERITQETNDYFKLISYDGKYLTNINDNFSLVDSKNTNDDPNQIIKYSINGDIIIKNKCLYNSNNKLMFGKCTNNINDKWSLVNNNIVSNKNNHCLSIDQNNNVVLEECDDQNQYQQFTRETPDFINYNDFKWVNNKGRNVVLTFNDNPWYLNKNLNVDLNTMNNKFKIKIPESIKPNTSNYILKTNHAKYKYNKNNNNNNNCTNNNIIENFEDTANNNNNNYLLIVFILIIIIIILLLIYKKKHLLFKS